MATQNPAFIKLAVQALRNKRGAVSEQDIRTLAKAIADLVDNVGDLATKINGFGPEVGRK